MELELLPFYLASFEESPESYLSPGRGAVRGYPVVGMIYEGLWGLYKMHQTLWFCLVSGLNINDGVLGLYNVRLQDDISAGRYACMS